MFTFKFFVRTDHSPLRVRFVSNRRKAELNLGLPTTARELDNAMSDRPSTANAALARMVRGYTAILKRLQIDLLEEGGRDMDATDVRDRAARLLLPGSGTPEEAAAQEDPLSWERYYERYAASKKNRSYRESCQYTLKKMRELCDGFSELKFDDITLKWLKDLDDRLIGSGASQNTRNIHFKNIRTCLNRAIDEELTSNYPFRRFKIKAEETRKRNLPVKELRRLFSYPVEDYQKYYLDYFKLIFMLIGINTIDLFNLTKIEDGRIEYRRAKTHKLYSIKVEPEAMEIIERHRSIDGRGLLDIADRWNDHRGFQKYCNIALKNIGEMKRVGLGGKKIIRPEWPEISTYWARHSWATIAYNDCEVSLDVISQALGHSDGHDMTNIYLDKKLRLIDEANRKVLDWVLYGRR